MPNNLGIPEKALWQLGTNDAINTIGEAQGRTHGLQTLVVRALGHESDVAEETDDPSKMALFVSKGQGHPWIKKGGTNHKQHLETNNWVDPAVNSLVIPEFIAGNNASITFKILHKEKVAAFDYYFDGRGTNNNGTLSYLYCDLNDKLQFSSNQRVYVDGVEITTNTVQLDEEGEYTIHSTLPQGAVIDSILQKYTGADKSISMIKNLYMSDDRFYPVDHTPPLVDGWTTWGNKVDSHTLLPNVDTTKGAYTIEFVYITDSEIETTSDTYAISLRRTDDAGYVSIQPKQSSGGWKISTNGKTAGQASFVPLNNTTYVVKLEYTGTQITLYVDNMVAHTVPVTDHGYFEYSDWEIATTIGSNLTDLVVGRGGSISNISTTGSIGIRKYKVDEEPVNLTVVETGVRPPNLIEDRWVTNGDYNQYISIPTISGTGDFDIEFNYIRNDSPSGTGFTTLLSGGTSPTDFRVTALDTGHAAVPNAIQVVMDAHYGGIANFFEDIPLGESCKIRLVREGTLIKHYLNGVNKGAVSKTGDWTIEQFLMDDNFANPCFKSISDVRINDKRLYPIDEGKTHSWKTEPDNLLTWTEPSPGVYERLTETSGKLILTNGDSAGCYVTVSMTVERLSAVNTTLRLYTRNSTNTANVLLEVLSLGDNIDIVGKLYPNNNGDMLWLDASKDAWRVTNLSWEECEVPVSVIDTISGQHGTRVNMDADNFEYIPKPNFDGQRVNMDATNFVYVEGEYPEPATIDNIHTTGKRVYLDGETNAVDESSTVIYPTTDYSEY